MPRTRSSCKHVYCMQCIAYVCVCVCMCCVCMCVNASQRQILRVKVRVMPVYVHVRMCVCVYANSNAHNKKDIQFLCGYLYITYESMYAYIYPWMIITVKTMMHMHGACISLYACARTSGGCCVHRGCMSDKLAMSGLFRHYFVCICFHLFSFASMQAVFGSGSCVGMHSLSTTTRAQAGYSYKAP